MNGLLYLFTKFYSCCQVNKFKKKYNNANTKCVPGFLLKISTEAISTVLVALRLKILKQTPECTITLTN